MEQIALWALTAAVGALSYVIYAIGQHIIRKQDDMEEAIKLLERDIKEDLASIRERLAKVESVVFTHKWGSSD
jgi:hypothetical protein